MTKQCMDCIVKPSRQGPLSNPCMFSPIRKHMHPIQFIVFVVLLFMILVRVDAIKRQLR